MIWNICFIISTLVLLIAVFRSAMLIRKHKSGVILTPFYTLCAGVFMAVFVGLIPIFADMLAGETGFIVKLIMIDFLQTIQTFTLNVAADWMLDKISCSSTAFSGAYSIYVTGLFLIAPILTFGFLASLLKNFFVKFDYLLHFRGEVFAFSELNEKSLALAQSIKQKKKRAIIVFADVNGKSSDGISENIESAKELRSIFFSKDIVSINLAKHSRKSQINIFAIGDNEGENLIRSLKLIEKYLNRKNTGLYVFSAGTEGEMLLSGASKGEVRVRRINDVRALIYNFLYDEGCRLFESAHKNSGNIKEINAVILGMGHHGTEMIKALTWYCQMDGYSVSIDAFEQDKLAKEKFSAQCPELMSEKFNGTHIPGDSEYKIRIHSGVDVRTQTFVDYMSALPNTTFVFVSLGNDTENINQAANVRMLCERNGCKPIIKTVVFNSDEANALRGITNYSGQEYKIEPIGDYQSTYSEEILLGNELEHLALERHLKWGQEDEFWQYEYNYRSSLASAIHMKARIACKIKGADKNEAGLTLEERNTIEALEHRRWNNYMRSEGYIYSGSPEKSSRNDLAKTHHDLINYESLNEEEKRKDSRLGTR